MNIKVLARTLASLIAAALVSFAALPAGAQGQMCGDLDASGTIAATDALILLKKAVGLDISVTCPDCSPTTTLPKTCRLSLCQADFFCDRPGCSGDGTCIPQAQVCDCELSASCDAVCGCDGVNYASSCAANRVGISVAGPAPCTGTCYDNGDCPASEYCELGCDCGGEGVCETRSPTCACELSGVCPDVCGCNGVTYSSICDAARAGVAVAHSGPCA